MQIQTLQTSPSGFNLQPTHIILLRSQQLKSTLSKHAMLGFGNQYRTNDASGIAVFISDLQPSKRIDRIYDMERQSGIREDGYLTVLRVAASFLTGESSTATSTTSSLSSDRGENNSSSSSTYLSSFLKQTFTHALSPIQSMPTMENVESWSYKNAGIMAQQYTMCATAHGLSTCMMEGYDARRVKEILRIPDRYGVPLMVATGYDYGTIADDVVHADIIDDDDSDGDRLDKRTPRLEMNELFFGDTFGQPLDLLLDSNEKNGTILPIDNNNTVAA